MIRMLLASALCLVFLGCQKDSDDNKVVTPNYGSVVVRVVDEIGQPQSAAIINVHKGDFDPYYTGSDHAVTDDEGYATLSERVLDGDLTIEAQDRFILRSILHADTTYVLHRTPRKVRKVGELIGKTTIILGDTLLSLDGSGRYQCVAVDSDGFHAGVILSILPEASVNSAIIADGFLWISMYNKGISKYDISDPFAPILLQTYPMFYGGPSLLGAKDSLILVNPSSSPLTIYRMMENGATEWLSSILNQSTISAARVYGHQLLITDGTGLYSYDISDPRSPILTTSCANSFYGHGYFFDNSVVMITGTGVENLSHYEPYDLTDPAAPRSLTRRLIPIRSVISMAGANAVVARYGDNSICLLEMSNVDSSFSVTASALTSDEGPAKLPLLIFGRWVWWVN